LEDGINFITWNLDQKGVEFPRLRTRDREDYEPGGTDVVPGKYKLLVEFNDHKDSTEIEVKSDPRTEVSVEDMIERNKISEDYEKVIVATKKAMDQLTSAKKKVKQVGGITDVLADSLKTELEDLNKETIQQIDSILNLFTEVKEVKGIVRDPAKYSGIIRTPNRYLYSSWGVPGENAENTIKIARGKAEDFINRTNSFISEEWESYKDRINAVNFEWFEETEKVEIEK